MNDILKRNPWGMIQIFTKQKQFRLVFYGAGPDFYSDLYPYDNKDDINNMASEICRKEGWDKNNPAKNS